MEIPFGIHLNFISLDFFKKVCYTIPIAFYQRNAKENPVIRKCIRGLVVLALVVLAGCSTLPQNDTSIIQTTDTPMFWEITSPTGTVVQILGTIHVGAPSDQLISQQVLADFRKADQRYGELGMEDMNELPAAVMKLLATTVLKDQEGNPVPITSLLDEETGSVLSLILQLGMANSGTPQEEVEAMLFMPPWYWNTVMNTAVTEVAGLSAELGIDTQLYNDAMSQNLSVSGLDSVKTQLDVLTYGSVEDQLILLEDIINSTLDGSANQELLNLYNAYVANDHETIASLTTNPFEGVEGLSDEYKDSYLTQLLYQRNQAWAETISTLLQEENKHYFIFAGAAHWLCGPTVFDYLVEEGVANWQ